MSRVRVIAGLSAAALALSLAMVVPASGAGQRGAPLRSTASATLETGIGAFTPAVTDPRLAAALARSGMSSSGFQFTPASSVRLNRSVTVAVRAQTNRSTNQNERVALLTPTAAAIAPIAYNLGVAIGWRKFAVSSDVAKVDIAGLGRRESVDVGVSYTARRLTGRLQVGADRTSGPMPRAITGGSGYSVDFGTSYSLTRDLDVTAGVRYRTASRDRLVPQTDDRRDSQAVYLGTAFRF